MQVYLMSNTTEEDTIRCVVDFISKQVHIYSDQGNKKTVICETSEEFMNVLKFLKTQLTEDKFETSSYFM